LAYWNGIGPETARQLRLQAESLKGSLWDAVENVSNNLKAFKQIKQRYKVANFYSFVNNIKQRENIVEIIEDFFKKFPESKLDRGCQKFVKYAANYEGKEEVISLKEIINNFEELMASGDLESEEEKQDGIQIRTMHSAKGLESPVVIIPAMEDDMFPGLSDINIEEKRRLFYVSITRARYLLCLSWAYQRMGPEIHMAKGRKRLDKKRSIFIDELKIL